jgi:hypothetical protein
MTAAVSPGSPWAVRSPRARSWAAQSRASSGRSWRRVLLVLARCSAGSPRPRRGLDHRACPWALLADGAAVELAGWPGTSFVSACGRAPGAARRARPGLDDGQGLGAGRAACDGRRFELGAVAEIEGIEPERWRFPARSTWPRCSTPAGSMLASACRAVITAAVRAPGIASVLSVRL